ncbi:MULTISPECIES: LexA family protein [Pseudomonas]|uniref:LexA family protein n=1 Tax=Pseudomonas TaxID=286 RepID=UPI001F2C212E|nr:MULTISPECIES: S24 family peptidase [Pseudomonas]MDU9415547.1 S24 family peptidase [Pseudomonas sp. zfem005]
MDIHQLRISALRRLIGSASLKEFADQHDLDSSYLSQILNGHRNLGERAAANMETKIGCAAGTLVAPAAAQNSVGNEGLSNVSPASQPSRYYRFPVVSSVVAGGWGDAIQAYEPGAEDRFEKTDTKVKGPAFWLEVEGDSMTSLSGPSIPEGMLILVDTGIEPQPGHLVVAKLDTEEKSTFKKLVQDGGKLYLKPLNTGYNPIEINGNCRIIGVVREAKMKLL